MTVTVLKGESDIKKIRPQENLSLKSTSSLQENIHQEMMFSRDPVKMLTGLRICLALQAANQEGCYKLQLLRL